MHGSDQQQERFSGFDSLQSSQRRLVHIQRSLSESRQLKAVSLKDNEPGKSPFAMGSKTVRTCFSDSPIVLYDVPSSWEVVERKEREAGEISVFGQFCKLMMRGW